MWRFNTAFLLQLVVVVSLCCLPMALDRQSGFVWSAFLAPILLACFVAIHVPQDGESRLKLNELSDSVVRIDASGGRGSQWLSRARILCAGGCLSVVAGFPSLHLIDPGPVELWLPIVSIFAVFACGLLFYSTVRILLVDQRQLVSEYRLLNCCFRRRRWQIEDDDYLQITVSGGAQVEGVPELRFCYILYLCRGRRRRWPLVVTWYAFNELPPGLEIAPDIDRLAKEVAELLSVGYDPKRRPQLYWWTP